MTPDLTRLESLAAAATPAIVEWINESREILSSGILSLREMSGSDEHSKPHKKELANLNAAVELLTALPALVAELRALQKKAEKADAVAQYAEAAAQVIRRDVNGYAPRASCWSISVEAKLSKALAEYYESLAATAPALREKGAGEETERKT